MPKPGWFGPIFTNLCRIKAVFTHTSPRTFRHALVATLCAAGLGFSAGAEAHKRWFVYTYDWYVPFRGEREIELHWRGGQDGQWKVMVEYEYGVDGRFSIAPYLIFEGDRGKSHLQGWKLETRYSFGEPAYGRLLHGAYVEVAKEKDEPYELEAKYIGTIELANGWAWSGNLVAEREMESRQAVKWGYSMGMARRMNSNLHFMVEAFGNWSEREHFVGPGIGYKIDGRSQVLGTVAFSTNRGGNQLRLLYEFEF